MELPSDSLPSSGSLNDRKHNYFTRSKTTMSGGIEEPNDKQSSTVHGRVLRSKQRVSENVDGKDNRKRGCSDLLHGTKSPNKPPKKSCGNINANVSETGHYPTSHSRIRSSNSAANLMQSEVSFNIRPHLTQGSPAFHKDRAYTVCQSSSGVSEISLSVMTSQSSWTVDMTMGSLIDDDMLSYSASQKRNRLTSNLLSGDDGEGTSQYPAALVRSLSDIKIPSLPRNKVLLNYNQDGTIQLLGEGEYGYVVRGVLRTAQTDLDIVAKYFKKNRSSIDDILDETRIQLYLLDTGFVPRVYGLVETRKDCDPIMVQECFGGGITLDDLLGRHVSRKVWFSLCIQVAKGLLKIHQKGVLVNDIKLDNILVDCQGNRTNIRFIDMGIATFRSSYVSGGSKAAMAECCHLAPEVRKLKPSTPKSDIYGLGFVYSTIGEEETIPELSTLGSKLMSEKPNQRYSLHTTVARLNSLFKNG